MTFCKVESYNPTNDQWTLRPSLNGSKGSLAGATVNNKIFAIGGGNGVDCFSEVEMLDLDIGQWIRTRSMLRKVNLCSNPLLLMQWLKNNWIFKILCCGPSSLFLFIKLFAVLLAFIFFINVSLTCHFLRHTPCISLLTLSP